MDRDEASADVWRDMSLRFSVRRSPGANVINRLMSLRESRFAEARGGCICLVRTESSESVCGNSNEERWGRTITILEARLMVIVEEALNDCRLLLRCSRMLITLLQNRENTAGTTIVSIPSSTHQKQNGKWTQNLSEGIEKELSISTQIHKNNKTLQF